MSCACQLVIKENDDDEVELLVLSFVMFLTDGDFQAMTMR